MCHGANWVCCSGNQTCHQRRICRIVVKCRYFLFLINDFTLINNYRQLLTLSTSLFQRMRGANDRLIPNLMNKQHSACSVNQFVYVVFCKIYCRFSGVKCFSFSFNTSTTDHNPNDENHCLTTTTTSILFSIAIFSSKY